MEVNFDKAATTQPDKKVIEAISPYLYDKYGNPSSNYKLGKECKQVIENARSIVASYIGAKPSEIVFTASSSESNQLSIKGYCEANNSDLITTTIEHIDVLMCAESLNTEVFKCEVDRDGRIKLDQLEDYCEKRVNPLVSVMFANNEIGTIEPIKEISEIVHKNGGKLFVDATQAITKVDIDVNELNVDMLSFSGHKIHALRGVGVLYVRDGIKLKPLVYGHQGLVAGTENTLAIASIGAALKLEHNNEYVKNLRDYFEMKVLTKIKSTYINGDLDNRVPNITNICFGKYEAITLQTMLGMDDIYCSTGSACNTDSIEPSYVLRAIGIKEPDIYGCLRFSFDQQNTRDEVDYVVQKIKESIEMLELVGMQKQGI